MSLSSVNSRPNLSNKRPNKFTSHDQADFKIAEILKWDAPDEARVGETIKVHIVRAVLHIDDSNPKTSCRN